MAKHKGLSFHWVSFLTQKFWVLNYKFYQIEFEKKKKRKNFSEKRIKFFSIWKRIKFFMKKKKERKEFLIWKRFLIFCVIFFCDGKSFEKESQKKKKKEKPTQSSDFLYKSELFNSWDTDTQTDMLNTKHYHFLFSDTQTDTMTIFTWAPALNPVFP